MSNETTTKFKVDISDLQADFQAAQRTIKTATAEFNASTAGLDNWNKSADGLSAKLKQLNTRLGGENDKLKSLKDQYERVSTAQGENSKGAQDLNVRLLNQQATVAKVEKQIRDYGLKLEKITENEKQSQTATSKLTSTISKQEAELIKLKEKYADLMIEQGKENSSSKDLKKQIGNLSESLNKNKDKLQNARDEADKLSKTFDNASKENSGITTFKIALGNLMSDGIGKILTGIKDTVTEVGNLDGAFDSFQGKTGKSSEEMGKYKEQIKDLYSNNYGENMQDLSDAMATVVKNSKETDPTKIKELTKNAIVLRDTFDFDIQESMRAVNMLTDQFGISGDEAFNLVVQGAQKGLDKNGDMLDSINEYAVHYKQMGYTANQFFNSLANGTNAGTFSVDKLGDAVKEFGIRSKDTSKTTTEGFELIGLDAGKMRESFSKGGSTAQKATQDTLNKLFELKDEVKQNQAGVDLFGTMWEDLGIEGIKALMNTQGELSKTKDSMKELDEIKYDDVQSQIKAVGRKFQDDVIIPIVEKGLPKFNDALDWVSEHLETLIPVGKGVGAVFVSIFAVTKLLKFIKTIKDATEALKTMKTISAMSSPIGWLTVGIGLVAAFGKETAITAGSTSKLSGNVEKAIKIIDKDAKKVDEVTQKYKDWKAEKDEVTNNVDAEFGYYQDLWDELQSIVDQNGKIKEGYEDRASFISDKLGGITGTEISINNGLITNYKNLKQSIDDVLESKKAQSILDANESSYQDAIANKNSAFEALTTAQNDLQKAEEAKSKLNEEQIAIEKRASEIRNGAKEKYQGELIALNRRSRDITEVESAPIDNKIKEQKKRYNEAKAAYTGYITTIKNYEGLSSAIISKDSKKIKTSLLLMQNNFKTTVTADKKQLTEQSKHFSEQLDEMKQALKDKMPGITQETVNDMQYLVKAANDELSKANTDFDLKGQELGNSFRQSFVNTAFGPIDFSKEKNKLLSPVSRFLNFQQELTTQNTAAPNNKNVVYNQTTYNQTINSPKSLSSSEIYRQTNNNLKRK